MAADEGVELSLYEGIFDGAKLFAHNEIFELGGSLT